MERMTRILDTGTIVPIHGPSEALKRLAAYEDTGMSPEDIAELLDDSHETRKARRGTPRTAFPTWGMAHGDDDVRPVAQWIPVEKGLPDKYAHVWAACRMEGREDWVIEVPYYGAPYWKNPWGRIPLLEDGRMQVYAWMPIEEPEPPGAEMRGEAGTDG